MDTHFTVAAHVMGYLAWRAGEGAEWVSSDEMGTSIQTHSVVVRRVLLKLKRSGLIVTRRGIHGGSCLSRPSTEINLGEVYDAVAEPQTKLVRFTTKSCADECHVGPSIEAVLREIVAESEVVFRKNLSQTSVAEFTGRVMARLCPEQVQKQK